MIKKAAVAGSVVCLGAIVLPLLSWGYAYWQTTKLRNEQALIMRETERMQRLASTLKDETGGGVVIEVDDTGKRYVALPFGVEDYQNMRYEDGRIGFRYVWPPAVRDQ